MEVGKTNSLVLKYILKFPKSWGMENFTATEYFTPNIFEIHRYNNLRSDYDLKELFDIKYLEPVIQNTNIRGKSNILLDMMYCLYFISPIFQSPNYQDIHKPLWYIDTRVIGIYTELIKQDITNFKRDLSKYINCYFSENSINNFHLINSINRNNNIGLKISNHNDIKTSLQLYLQHSNFNNSFEYEIDLSKIDRLITLLKNYEVKDPKDNPKNYIISNGCFCMAESQNQFYFSISGVGPKYDNFGKEIESFLKQYFKYNSINYCPLNDETLSFIKKNKKKKIIPCIPPLRYGDIKQHLNEKESSYLYSCCERKIFSNLQNKNDLILICKYNPCIKCIPAVEIEKKTRKTFIFYAFAQNSEEFKKYLNKAKDKLIQKIELNIVNII